MKSSSCAFACIVCFVSGLSVSQFWALRPIEAQSLHVTDSNAAIEAPKPEGLTLCQYVSACEHYEKQADFSKTIDRTLFSHYLTKIITLRDHYESPGSAAEACKHALAHINNFERRYLGMRVRILEKLAVLHYAENRNQDELSTLRSIIKLGNDNIPLLRAGDSEEEEFVRAWANQFLAVYRRALITYCSHADEPQYLDVIPSVYAELPMSVRGSEKKIFLAPNVLKKAEYFGMTNLLLERLKLSEKLDQMDKEAVTTVQQILDDWVKYDRSTQILMKSGPRINSRKHGVPEFKITPKSP